MGIVLWCGYCVVVWVLCCSVGIVLWCGYCVVVWVLCCGVGIVLWGGCCVVVWVLCCGVDIVQCPWNLFALRHLVITIYATTRNYDFNLNYILI